MLRRVDLARFRGGSVNRRLLLRALLTGGLVVVGGRIFLRSTPDSEPEELVLEESAMSMVEQGLPVITHDDAQVIQTLAGDDNHVKDYLMKMRNFDAAHEGDISLTGKDFTTLQSVVQRLERAQRFIGHANFSLVSLDRLVFYASNYSKIGAFTKAELDLMDGVFHRDARDYGFQGGKVSSDFTQEIKARETVKINNSGNYLFRGKPEQLLKKIRKDLGENVVLTSGIRGVVKQLYLFLDKAVNAQGNLSLASRSLAPPGYSYHGVSDFDVGKRGYGYKNFTAAFAETQEYRVLTQLGYLNMRYPLDNMLGVRFEPWHVKVV